MNMETIRDVLVSYGPLMVIGVAVVSLGLTAVVFGAFLMNELFFKQKESHAGHGHAGHAHGDHGHGHAGHH